MKNAVSAIKNFLSRHRGMPRLILCLIALITVTGRIRSISLVRFITVATDMAPNATWDRPSPMKEKRRRTRVTPSSAEQSATSTETIRAYRTKGNCRYIPNFAIIPPPCPF